VHAAHVLYDPVQRRSRAHATEGLGVGAVDAHDQLVQTRVEQPGSHRVIQEQRVGRHLRAQFAGLRRADHVEETRVQQGSPRPMNAMMPPAATPSTAASNVAHSMNPSGSFQEWRTQVAQARLQALVGST
jgi:hypothetical protein